MQTYFNTLVDSLTTHLTGHEVFLCYFNGEQSDFIRFNRAKIRQAGTVVQNYVQLELIDGKHHAIGELALSGELIIDSNRMRQLLSDLRAKLPFLPDDPFLLYATKVQHSEKLGKNQLPDVQDSVDEILTTVQGNDFVGFYASGGIFTGFANSLGQRNWHSSYTFNLDWSFYHDKDKAVKAAYAGFQWDNEQFQSKISQSLAQLTLLKRPARTIAPGAYRVYLSPTALYEIFTLLGENSFGLKAQKSKQSALFRMLAASPQQLHSTVTLRENTLAGITPTFQNQGFTKPNDVTLIEHGKYQSALISPRSAQEYDVVTNGADSTERPCSLDLAAGHFSTQNILSELDTGIYINNLWYTNYSDLAACRITGMTRFATFWVEKGEIVAPLNVMRFDETLYHMLGKNLLALTDKQEFILSNNTYERRSTDSARLPGALVDDFVLTL